MVMKNCKLINELKFYRSKLGITQKELAEFLCVNPSYYNRIEKGIITPNIKLCLMLVDAIKELYAQKTGRRPEKISIDRLFMLDDTD